MLARSGEHRLQQQTDELQCKILEGERRPVKQFEQPEPGVELHQRRNCQMAKPVIGSGRDVSQLGTGKVIAGKEGNEAGGKLAVGEAGVTAQGCLIELGQLARQVESAIRGEAGEKNLRE